MIGNGYLFARDNKRIFINTSLGYAGQRVYCSLSKVISKKIIELFLQKL